MTPALWTKATAQRRVIRVRPIGRSAPELEVLPIALRSEGLAAVWLSPVHGIVSVSLTPAAGLDAWESLGERQWVPPLDLAREIERGRPGVWGRGDLALAEALVVAWHLARRGTILYRKVEALGAPGETRRITPTRLAGASIGAWDHDRGGQRTFKLQGIDALELTREEVGVAWEDGAYRLGGRAA